MQGIMKRLISFFILLSVICCSANANSESVEKTDPAFVLLDVILYRPVGLVITVVGTAVFVAVTPLIGLASIPAPHDAFAKTSNILVVAPATYTFVRSIGDRDFPYVASPNLYKTTVTQKPVQPPVPAPVVPVAPKVQTPEVLPPSIKGL